MFTTPSGSRIWLYAQPTDMRKSFRGLIVLVKQHLREVPTSGAYFVFINRRKTQMKILYFESSGYCLWSKRLEQGQFNYTENTSGKQALDTLSLQWLIEGIKVEKIRRYKRYSHAA